MDALSSVSPFSRNPESRQSPGAPLIAFSMDEPPPERERAPAPAPARQGPNEATGHEPLAQACALACGPAWQASLDMARELLAQAPELGLAAHIWRDERGAPIQALPALACAAIQGADPEGWALELARWGASFDTRQSRSEARAELVGMAGPRGGRLLALNARLDSLSLWTLACAEADHPHSAIRAIDAVRERHPLLLGPLPSELARFADPASWDKPTLSAKARAGAFVEAGKGLDHFCSTLLPSWAQSPRGPDLAPIATPIAQALSTPEAASLASVLGSFDPQLAGVSSLLSATLLELDRRSAHSAS
jgi:hypothetical protein